MAIAKAMLAAALLALAAGGVTGCKGPASVQEAAPRVVAFHQRLDAGDFEAIWMETGNDMRVATSKADFIGLLGRVHAQLGKVRESKQTGWQTRSDNTGSFTEVTMRTQFERGAGRETFIFRNAEGGQILSGYHIDPSD